MNPRPDCEMRIRPDCQEEAAYVTAQGAGGDTYACGPCMNAAEDVEPGDWVALTELAPWALP